MLANDISTITTWWESTISVLGDYCGSDSAGQQFRAAYQPKVDSIDQALPGAVQQLYGIGTALRLRQLAQYVDGVDRDRAQAAGDVIKGSVGQSIDAFRTASDHAGRGLSDLSALASNLADGVEEYGHQVEEARKRVKLIIEQIVTTVTVGILFGFISDGIGDLLAAPRVIAGLAAIAGELSRSTS